MYHALPIGLTALVIYLFTLFLSSAGFLTKQSHRRFWNWLLFATFFVTALLGLFMALKITYKWSIPFSEPFLHWHVEVGIAMAFTAIIHLTWHFSYYFSKNKIGVKEGIREVEYGNHTQTGVAGILLMLTGFASSAVQFILMREAVILGGGTEISMGLFLWTWLIIAAAGAVAGGRSGSTGFAKMMWTLIGGMALAPLLFMLMNRALLNPGESPSIIKVMIILSVSVAPVTFISSFVFVRLSSARQYGGGSTPGGSFGIETAGSVVAGLLTAVTVTFRISNYQLYILILLLSAAVTVALLNYPVMLRRAVWMCAAISGVIILIFSPDPAIRSFLLRGVKAEKSIDTPYGNITTGTYGGERTVFYDHRPLFFSGDIIRDEEDIHYALLQREKYNRVMMISGGLNKHIEQLTKYEINEVVYLEHDPGIIAAEGARDTLAGRINVSVRKTDPLTFLRRNTGIYDAVLQLIPPPSTLSVSRFFTVEYFRAIREHLSSEGLFLCTPMPVYNYSPESYRKALSPIYNALRVVFNNVIIIPGSSLYVIASDGPLSDSISVMAGRRAIQNSYVNSDYINDDEVRRKSQLIISDIDPAAPVNTAIRPVSSWFANMLSLESKGTNGALVVVMFLLIIIPFALIRRGGFMMFASSAGLSGFGMIMIFILQVTAGNIYILSALILTLLMAGLAAGAARDRLPGTRKMIVYPIILAIIYGGTGFLIPSLVSASPRIVLPFIFVILLSAGFLTGMIYRTLTASGSQGRTGAVYASDLAGSALGYLTVSTIVVPLAGTGNASFILAALILVSGIIVSVHIKH
ncbi:MAG: hypothetical protein WCD55_02620 [Bacteroidales bacterium]